MSREEVITWLEKSAPVCVCTSSEFGEFIKAVNKAISDIEKLQKIEALYEQQEFGKGLSREERDREVQKILEEGQ